jgi:DNA helicase-2/ATP-dependent DNA helicase PcrA
MQPEGLPVILTAEQRAAVEATGGNVLVLAGPGTGKTTVIASRFAALVAGGIAPESILALTFSRRAAAELRERLAAAAPGSHVEVRTFHGFASRLIEADGPRFRSRRLLDSFAQRIVLENALESVEPKGYARDAWRARRFCSEAATLLADLERTLPEALDEIRARATPRIRDLLALDARARALRAQLRASDLNGLMSRAVAALADERSPQALWLAGRYTHVLIDEFQDVDRIQFELLAALARRGARLFAVGDPAQAIYRFRGATHGIVELARERFAMQAFTLATSRRCPQPVCDFAAATPLLGATPLTSAAARAGTLPEIARARSAADEASLVADRIEAALERGTPAESIAVLLRALHPFSWMLASELRSRGIPFLAPPRDALLADPLVEVVRAALELFRAPRDIKRWRHLLSTETLGFDPLALRLAIREFPPGGFEAALKTFDGAGIEPGRMAWLDVSRALAAANAHWVAGDLGACARALARELGLFASIIGGEARAPLAARASIARLHGFIDALAGAQRTLAQLGRPALSGDVVARLDEHLDAFAQERAPEPGEPGVRILTVHGAKGLEFDDVIIADAAEGRFPQEERPCALFDADERAIFETAGVDSALFGGERQRIEEASLWYVAVTRARDRLTITYACEDLGGTPQRPSRFIPAQYALGAAAPVHRRSLERIESLALGDGLLSAELARDERVRGAPLLADYVTHGDAIFAPLQPRPIVARDVIGVGAVGEWYRCRRRYYYSRLLHLESERGTAFTLGTLLHDILRTFHERNRNFSPVAAGDAARWTGILRALIEERLDESAFEIPAEAAAARVFLARALASYANALQADALATPFVVEACEQVVKIPLGSGILSGRIDRVDRADDGSLILRDYKSGQKRERFTDALAKMEKALGAGALTYAGIAEGLNPQLALYRAGLPGVGRFDYIYFKGEDERRDLVVSDATDVAAVAPLLDLLLEDVREHLVDALATGALDEMPTTARAQNCRRCAHENLCDGPQA